MVKIYTRILIQFKDIADKNDMDKVMSYIQRYNPKPDSNYLHGSYRLGISVNSKDLDQAYIHLKMCKKTINLFNKIVRVIQIVDEDLAKNGFPILQLVGIPFDFIRVSEREGNTYAGHDINSTLESILKKYSNVDQNKKSILACQKDLIDAGLENFATYDKSIMF